MQFGLRKDSTKAVGEPISAVGDTVVASMQDNVSVDGHRLKFAHRSAEPLMLTVVKRILSAFRPEELNPSFVQLVESLIWPFVARRSLRDPWFSDKELKRFIHSMTITSKRIHRFLSPDNREQTFLKYWLDYYLCQVFRDSQRPAREDWITVPLFSGWCKRSIARAIAKRDVAFIYSLQKGSKRHWPELGVLKERAAYDKHAQRISESHGPVPADLSEIISQTSEATLGKGKYENGTRFMPSGSACSQAGRRDGGALSLFEPLDLNLNAHDARVMGKLVYLTATVNTWRRKTFIEAAKISHGMINSDPVCPYADRLVTGEWVTSRNYRNPFDVNVQAIPEPGKFRIITKGDGYLYTALQPFQGVMLDCWKKSVYSTMLHDDLTSRVREIDSQMAGENYLWCSVDYEAATDLLKRDATAAAFGPLYGKSPQSDMAFQSLFGEGWAHYPVEYKTKPNGKLVKPRVIEWQRESVRICEGQLMGHPLSFPLLCVINLACYFCAIDRWIKDAEFCLGVDPIILKSLGRKYPQMAHRVRRVQCLRKAAGFPYMVADDEVLSALKEIDRRREVGKKMKGNAIVNGDDMLFKCERSFYPFFVGASSDAGFKMLVGKQYLLEDCAMINSQVFFRDGTSKMIRKGYLNMKLVTGKSLKGGDSTATPTQISRDLGKMAELCPWTACAIPFALKRWSGDWSGILRPNWYLPVHLGGFGLNPKLAPPGIRITKWQRLLAARFVHDPRMALYRRKGMSLSSVKLAGALANWKLVIGDYVAEEHESDELVDAWLARIAYATRAHQGCKPVSDKIFATKFKPEYRLKPMSVHGIELYWDARLYASRLPPCPPLCTLPLSSGLITGLWPRGSADIAFMNGKLYF
jgi:hypothetical protein